MGFVSNSSSSNFICKVCGTIYEQYDESLGDLEVVCCSNGHYMCEEHILDPNRKQMISLIHMACNGETHGFNTDDEADYLHTISKMDEIDFMEYKWTFFKSGRLRNNMPSCLCPICQFEVFDNRELKAYITKSYALDEEKIKDEIRKNFKNYRQFIKFI